MLAVGGLLPHMMNDYKPEHFYSSLPKRQRGSIWRLVYKGQVQEWSSKGADKMIHISQMKQILRLNELFAVIKDLRFFEEIWKDLRNKQERFPLLVWQIQGLHINGSEVYSRMRKFRTTNEAYVTARELKPKNIGNVKKYKVLNTRNQA